MPHPILFFRFIKSFINLDNDICWWALAATKLSLVFCPVVAIIMVIVDKTPCDILQSLFQLMCISPRDSTYFSIAENTGEGKNVVAALDNRASVGGEVLSCSVYLEQEMTYNKKINNAIKLILLWSSYRNLKWCNQCNPRSASFLVVVVVFCLSHDCFFCYDLCVLFILILP